MIVKKRNRFLVFVVCVVVVFTFGFIGSIFTSAEVNSAWYDSVKSSLTPPNFVFPIVWNILFFLIALSLYFSWINSKNNKIKLRVAEFYLLNLIFNALWSIFFFGMKNTALAFIDLTAIWLSIILLMRYNWKISKASSWLLLPYLLWVSFAGILNWLAIFSFG